LGAKKIKVVKKPVKQSLPVPVEPAVERLRTWVEKNLRYLLGAMLLVLVPLALLAAKNGYSSWQEARARDAYAQVLSKTGAGQGATDEVLGKAVSPLEEFIRDHSGTAPGLDARFELQKTFFRLRRYQDCLKAGVELLGKLPPGHALRPLVSYQMALAANGAGDTEQALAKWLEVKATGYAGLHREADWNIARIYAGKQDFAKAAESYESALKAEGSYPEPALLEQELATVKTHLAPRAGEQKEAAGGSS
jgi:hypothetical protein